LANAMANHHPLALAAGKLVGDTHRAAPPPAATDQVQQLQRPRTRGGTPERFMDEQHLVDLFLDGVQRVERGHGLLEDHGDAVAPHTA